MSASSQKICIEAKNRTLHLMKMKIYQHFSIIYKDPLLCSLTFLFDVLSLTTTISTTNKLLMQSKLTRSHIWDHMYTQHISAQENLLPSQFLASKNKTIINQTECLFSILMSFTMYLYQVPQRVKAFFRIQHRRFWQNTTWYNLCEVKGGYWWVATT